MVCTLASGRISANFPKLGKVSEVVRLWVWSHMPFHNLRRHSILSYKYAIDMGCSSKGSTASTKHSGIVCTLASGWISVNSYKSGEMYVVAAMWMWGHMPILNLRRCSTPYIGMPWTWDTDWKVLQLQSKRSVMVSTLALGRIKANLSKSGESSVVVTVWEWCHMPIHNLRRRSNTSYMYDMDMGKSLKVLQPKSMCSGMVCTPASGRISANFPKSGEHGSRDDSILSAKLIRIAPETSSF